MTSDQRQDINFKSTKQKYLRKNLLSQKLLNSI